MCIDGLHFWHQRRAAIHGKFFTLRILASLALVPCSVAASSLVASGIENSRSRAILIARAESVSLIGGPTIGSSESLARLLR